jgi:integrase/recombinase XerD
MTPDKARTHRGEPYSPGYVNNLYRGLKQFYVWRTETEDIDNPMARMKPPKVDDKIVPVPQDDEVAAILKPVERAKDFNSRREHAILRLFLSSGMRLAELHGLTADDFAIKNGRVRVLGKGNKERMAKFDFKTAAAINQYPRVRTLHKQQNGRNPSC